MQFSKSDHRKVISILQGTTAQKGKYAAEIHEELMQGIAPDDRRGNFRQTRKLILEVIEVRRIPIASGNQGFFIARTEEDFLKEMKKLNSHITGYRSRMKAFNKAYKKPSRRIIKRRQKE